MSDIAKRLRLQAEYGLLGVPDGYVTVSYGDAADEIERLSARIVELEQERDEARRHHQEYLLSYIKNVKTIAERFKLEPSELQLQWRQGKRTDRSEVEWAIVDALAVGCEVAYPGDGVGCAAQIVFAQMDRAEAAEAANAAMTTAASALIDFHNAPVEERRPDIHQRLLQRLANTIPSTSPTGEK